MTSPWMLGSFSPVEGYRSYWPHKGLEVAFTCNLFVSTTVSVTVLLLEGYAYIDETLDWSFKKHIKGSLGQFIFQLGTWNHKIIEHISSIWIIHTFRPPVFPQWLTLCQFCSLFTVVIWTLSSRWYQIFCHFPTDAGPQFVSKPNLPCLGSEVNLFPVYLGKLTVDS